MGAMFLADLPGHPCPKCREETLELYELHGEPFVSCSNCRSQFEPCKDAELVRQDVYQNPAKYGLCPV